MVLVGSPPFNFTVHYSLLEDVPFFRKMLRKCSTAATVFPEISPAAFSVYIQWLTNRTIDPWNGWRRVGYTDHPLGEAVKGVSVRSTLLSAYALGETINDTDFKDVVMDALVTATIQSGELDKELLWRFCATTSAKNAGRRFFIDLLVLSEGAAAMISEDARRFLDKDFLLNLSAALLKAKDETVSAEIPWNDRDSCAYHEHLRLKGSCYKAHTPEATRQMLADNVKRWVAEENLQSVAQEDVDLEKHHKVGLPETKNLQARGTAPIEVKDTPPTKRTGRPRANSCLKRSGDSRRSLKVRFRTESQAEPLSSNELSHQPSSPHNVSTNHTPVHSTSSARSDPSDDASSPPSSPSTRASRLQEARFIAEHDRGLSARDKFTALPTRGSKKSKRMTPQAQEAKIEQLKRALARFDSSRAQVQPDGVVEAEEVVAADGDRRGGEQDVVEAAGTRESSETSEEE